MPKTPATLHSIILEVNKQMRPFHHVVVEKFALLTPQTAYAVGNGYKIRLLVSSLLQTRRTEMSGGHEDGTVCLANKYTIGMNK